MTRSRRAWSATPVRRPDWLRQAVAALAAGGLATAGLVHVGMVGAASAVDRARVAAAARRPATIDRLGGADAPTIVANTWAGGLGTTTPDRVILVREGDLLGAATAANMATADPVLLLAPDGSVPQSTAQTIAGWAPAAVAVVGSPPTAAALARFTSLGAVVRPAPPAPLISSAAVVVGLEGDPYAGLAIVTSRSLRVPVVLTRPSASPVLPVAVRDVLLVSRASPATDALAEALGPAVRVERMGDLDPASAMVWASRRAKAAPRRVLLTGLTDLAVLAPLAGWLASSDTRLLLAREGCLPAPTSGEIDRLGVRAFLLLGAGRRTHLADGVPLACESRPYDFTVSGEAPAPVVDAVHDAVRAVLGELGGDNVVHVHLYSDRNAAVRGSAAIVGGTEAMWAARWKGVAAISVRDWIGVLVPDLPTQPGLARLAVAHEVVHAVQHDAAQYATDVAPVPRWLVEGSAQWLALRVAAQRQWLDAAAVTGIRADWHERAAARTRPLRDYERSLGDGAEYDLGAEAAAALAARAGPDALIVFFSELSPVESWTVSFRHAFGIDLDTFYELFERERR